jgi:hypothetical protein
LTDIIVSYDGSSTDDDGLVLGKMLARTGALLSLAYVRHSREFDPKREELAQHDAARRLQHGTTWIGVEGGQQHIVVNPSTPEGLRRLADGESAKVVVFGSDYRTPPGHAEPGAAALGMLDGGPVAIGIAAAGLRLNPDAKIEQITVYAGDGVPDPTASQTATSLAAKLGAEVIAPNSVSADLIVVPSQTGGPAGKVQLSSPARAWLNSARGSVLMLPGATPLDL